MVGISGFELLIILLIIVILFGVGRISKLSEEIGRGIRIFRNAIKGNNPEDTSKSPPKIKSDDLDDY